MADVFLYVGAANPTDVILHDPSLPELTLALTGVSCQGITGVVRITVPIISGIGQLLVQMDVALVGQESATATGSLAADADRTQALTGLSSTTATGLLVPSNDGVLSGTESVSATGSAGVDAQLPLTGLESASATGTVSVQAQDVTLELVGVSADGLAGTLTASGGDTASTDDEWLMRRRRSVIRRRNLRGRRCKANSDTDCEWD